MATDYSINKDIMARELIPLKQLTGKKLSKKFYLQNCLRVAKELIGKVLVRKIGRKIYAGIIVETEAYLGDKDPASHAFKGKTKRNEVMFEEGGVCYVYFTYGNHYCMNVVTREKNVAHAVLIRALEPLKGIAFIMKNRKTHNLYNLTNGPGKLTQAFKIDTKLNGMGFSGGKLSLAEPKPGAQHKVMCSKRIGITKNADRLWRFYVSDNPFVSGAKVKSILKKKSR